MLLPFLVFVPNAFYYGFNEHAVAQERTEQVPVYYDTNEISQISDFVHGNIYHYSDNVTLPSEHTSGVILYFDYSPNLATLGITERDTGLCFNVGGDNTNVYIYYKKNGSIPTQIVINSQPFDFVFDRSGSNISTFNYLIDKFGKSDLLVPTGETTPVTTSMSITDSMSYAWDSVWQNDLFSWSYGSFLTEPFIYIGNIFNVPEANALYYALSYWLDISIIWLCFDMVMYIPLLVHRWLDKGIIE